MRGDGASLARQVARRDSVGVARRGGAEKGFNGRPRSERGMPMPVAMRGVARLLDEPDETVVVDPLSALGAHACMLSPPRPKGKRWGAAGVECGRRQLEQKVQKVVTRSTAGGPRLSTGRVRASTIRAPTPCATHGRAARMARTRSRIHASRSALAASMDS